ncbi:uncharacterized protein [Eurosta solidaginis]|uniref:uncharacterized protein n=1 Tax=Eurosta solidaginis TaxID=178769 RepID=UPI003530FA62
MELNSDLSAIQNEDLLRRMWEKTEDNDYKKKIRTQLYKLRESGLRDLYQGEIMAGNFAKDPLNASHGDSLVGQNFQSLKSKEVRDSVSPTSDLKFHSMTLQHPNSTGWNVQTSSEVSPDGRAYRSDTLATTDGVEKINGGTAEFLGRNEQHASASHQGDDKNFVKKASESSNTHLQEHVVIGDENSGRTEVKSSSTTTSSSHVTSSSSTVEYVDGAPLDAKYIMDNTNRKKHHDQQQRLTQEQYIQQEQQRQQQLQQQEFEQIKKYQQQQKQVQHHYTEEFKRNREESSTSRNMDTQQTTEQSRRVVDMDKASPEYQQHVQHLMSQPGEIISNTVEYPKPNVKMITTVKRLPDGTIVKNKRYETEELKPTLENQRQRTTSTTSQSSTQQHKNEQQRRQQTEENIYNRQEQNLHNTTTTRRHENDVVDNAEPLTRVSHVPQQQPLVKPKHPTEQYTDEVSNVETKFSSTKKSSKRYSTETTSETIEEVADQVRGKLGQDFSTHGFPSVRPNKLTQEYAGERPHGERPQDDFSTHGFPSVKPNKPTQEYPSHRAPASRSDDVEYINQRTVTQTNQHGYPTAVKPNVTNITTIKDGDIVVESAESTRSSKYKTNTERTIETEVIIEGEHPQKRTAPGAIDAVRSYEQPAEPRRPRPTEDYTTHGFPSVRDVAKPHTTQPSPTPLSIINENGSVTVVSSSETKKTVKHNENREHIIETEIFGDHDYRTPTADAGVRQPDTITFPPTPQPSSDYSTHGFPSVRDTAQTDDANRRQVTPIRETPSSSRKPMEDFSTHGFPSVRTPTTNKTAQDYYARPAAGFPSNRNNAAPKLAPTQPSRIQPSTTSTSTKKLTSTTTDSASQRLITKERDVDASHRAFAASLRCSSPADSIDHHQQQPHQRMTPRSSVSSNRTFRRDGREGSHDSETSRFSTGTASQRSSPSKSSLGKTVVTKLTTTVNNKARNGSNETIDLTPQRHTKSPSPSKHLTTTTPTTRTTTTTSNRKSPTSSVGVPKTDKQKLSKPAEKNVYPISTINVPTTLTIKKTHFNDNDASFLANERAAVVEEPIIKEHFYKLGPSDKATENVDEKSSSPFSPTAPSNHHNLHRTHPKSNDFEDVYHEEPISHNQPLNSSVIVPKQRNPSPDQGPKSPQHICQSTKNEETSNIEEERRTVVREKTFENYDWQDTILDTESNKKPYTVNGKPRNDEVPRDDYNETIDIDADETYIDTSDYPGESFFTKKPKDKEPTHKKTLDTVNKSPKVGAQGEPLNRKTNEKQPRAPSAGRKPEDKKPIEKTTSPTRRTSDVNKTKVSTTTTTSYKTTRNHNINATNEDKQPSCRKPSEIGKSRPDKEQKSPTRKATETSKDRKQQTVKPAKSEPCDESSERKPTRKRTITVELSPTCSTLSDTTSNINTIELTRKDKPQPVDKPEHKQTTNNGPKPIDRKPPGTDFVAKKNIDTNKVRTTAVTTTSSKIRDENVSPTRIEKSADRTTDHMQRKPSRDNITTPKGGKQTVEPVCRKSPIRASEPQDSEDEYSQINRKLLVCNETAKTESTHVRNLKSNLKTSTTETNTDEVLEDKPSDRKPLGKKPTEAEYSDEDDEEIIRITTERGNIKSTHNKPQRPNEYDEEYENVSTKSRKGRPHEPESCIQSKKPIEEQTTAFITTKVKTLHANEPRYTTTDETQRVEELFNKTNKKQATENITEEFITFESKVGDKTQVSDKSLQPGDRKPTTKKPSEPYDNDTKPSTVERLTESFEETKNIQRSAQKPNQPLRSEPKHKLTDNTKEPAAFETVTEKSKLMQQRNTDSSEDDDEQQAAQTTYETTTITTSRKDIRTNKSETTADDKEPLNSAPDACEPRFEDQNVKTATTITKNVIERRPVYDSEIFIEPLDRVPSSDEIKRVEELFQTTNDTNKYTKNSNKEFIDIESTQKVMPDGAFFSKAPEPEPNSPTYKKKGVNPRETFEDRCRQILGMEEYGDTPGSYKNKPDDKSNEKPIDKAVNKPVVGEEQVTGNKTEFEVRIGDCEDDEPNYFNNIKEAIKPQKEVPKNTYTNEKPKKRADIDFSDKDLIEEVECVIKETVVPFKRDTAEKEMHTTSKSTRVSRTYVKNEENINANTKNITKTTPKTNKKITDVEPIKYSTSESETADKDTDEESQPDTVVTETEMECRKEDAEEQKITLKNEPRKPLKKLVDEKRPSPNSSPSTSPIRNPKEPQVNGKSSTFKQDSTRNTRVTTAKTTETKTLETKQKPRENNSATKTPEKPENKHKPTSPTRPHTGHTQKVESPKTPVDSEKKKPHKETPNSTIKDRLRSATHNKQPTDTESDSSPAMSPTRFTERRRSSNISVHTEIIIDHTAPKSPKPAEKTLEKHKPQIKKTTTPKESEDTPTKEFRRQLVTERKESAPVPSVTRKDKSAIMTRSTSEQVMKVSNKPTEVDSYAPRASHIPTVPAKGERRPNKCFTTKTINLTTTDKRINAHEMENVVIDIQHAKSSREPSPDKIVPTPVPVHMDTGKPRYPDVVQEPEDEPRKKPVITNIPIFEEESNEFVNCHITEIKTDKIARLVDLQEDDILDNPTIEAPKSLDYPSLDKPDDDCLLSVHEKVSKFTHTAEEVKKPKASSPFSREFDKTPKVPENDECLLSVDEKVNKFIKTAEEVTKLTTPVREIERPNYSDLDEELRRDDCTLTVSQKVNKFLSTAEKLADTTPQKSPELVAKITRTISKQSEPGYPEGVSDDDELMPFSENHTIEIEKRRQKDILSRPTVFENTTRTKRYTDHAREDEVTTVKRTLGAPEEDEIIPHTKDHVTKIELKRQKEILSRPSIYDTNKKPRAQSPIKREPNGTQNVPQTVVTKTKMQVTTTKKVSADDDSEIINIDIERKPSTPTNKLENRKSPIKLQTSTVALTKQRFEVGDTRKVAPESPVKPKTHKVPFSVPAARKPSKDEPQTREHSTTGRKKTTEPVDDATSPYERKPSSGERVHQTPPQRCQRKPSTESVNQYPRRKPSAETEININDYDSETEFTSETRRRSSSNTKDYLETVQTEIERFSPTEKEPKRKALITENSKPQTLSQSPTRYGTISTNKTSTKVIERTNQHHTPSPDCSDIEIIETIVEQHPERQVKTQTPTTTTTIGRTRITNDTVAARRNIFENGATTSKTQSPFGSNSPSPVGRRPSYMDHTVSSLEHIRRDSLEVNKQNYSRKSSVESEHNYGGRSNAAVKFDVPQKPQRTASIPEDIDVENIFELEVLERLLETVTSYELRRRIRAQIRLVKKNLLNTETLVDKSQSETKTSKSINSTHKSSTYTSNVHRQETDVKQEEDIQIKRPYERTTSPKRPQTTEECAPQKATNARSTSPKHHGKLYTDEEMTTTATTYSKTPNGRSKSTKRPTSSPERAHSPESGKSHEFVKEIRRTSASSKSSRHKEYACSEQTDYAEERYDNSRKVYEKPKSKPHTAPKSKSPVGDGRKIPDSNMKSRTKSPDTGNKPSYQRTTSTQGRTTSPQGRTTSPQGRAPKQRDDMYTTTKVTTVKTTRSQPERKSSKPRTDDNSAPIWVDRTNLLKSPSSSPRRVPASPAMRTTASKTITSKTTSQRQTQQHNRNIEEDCITSSYGIGPTDENGLPLFGIKALKKKKSSQPCETTEEVTGYVIEEKYYSDSKTKPKVERKEYIYSTNADELEEMKKSVDQTRKSSRDNVDVIRKFEKIEKNHAFEKPEATMPDTEEFNTTSSQYVRRGSVKELSEKFIRKESTHSTAEKSGYPKAGLILRTSRGSSAEPCGDAYETTTEKYITTTSNRGQGYCSMGGDSEDEQNVELRQKKSRHLFSEFDKDESEERHMNTSRSSTKFTRSFLNSSGETKVVTSVDDALERMRSADYVVEAGDTAEDREARSLLNKFLGASVIMKGVESVIPTTKQIKTTTITKTSYKSGEATVKTTRITKTTKSGSSSTPVTRTTCDIEEIWDEEILKQLLEQATTYEERRKIRARLRDLMAEREEKKSLKSGEQSQNTPEVDESSASEYEEIIEEITVSDYSDAEADLGEDVGEEEEKFNSVVKKPAESKAKESPTSTKPEAKSNEIIQTVQANENATRKASNSAVECEVKDKSSIDKIDAKTANDKGESLVPILQSILQKSLPKVVAKSLFKTEQIPNTKVERVTETSIQTNKGCNSTSNNNSSSDLCTVNNSNNQKKSSSSPTEHTNNTTNTKTDSNTQRKTSQEHQERKSLIQSLDSTPDISQDFQVTEMTKNSSNRPTVSASKQKPLNRLSVPQKEDSGTESGEDLRLIAAGLRDSLHLQSDTNLIEEVTAALTRLEQSLKEGNKDIPVDGSKREALLALVARLQTGLTSPEAALNLTNMAGNSGQYDDTSSPEAEAQRANRSRFARRRNRNSRHTVGVSREELEDARRYMEDMIMLENISNCTTPDSGTLTQAPFFPIEKNPSTGALLPTNSASSTLYRPNQFMPTQLKNSTTNLRPPEKEYVKLREKDGEQNSKRPLSGNFTVTFESSGHTQAKAHINHHEVPATELHSHGTISPDAGFKSNRFTNKKQLMKRANTIDIPKTKKYNPDFDSDSEPEDKAPQLGLKRTLQVNVKQKVRNVIPPFVPKTENDHKFLAFINKQNDKPGLGWVGARSVSNWTNKFGNLKHAFEVGAAAQTTTGKPPQAPAHVPHNAAKNYWQKQVATQDCHEQQQQQQQQQYIQYQPQQQQLQRSQQEAHERQRRLERERFERERIERDRLDRQRLERERHERDRIEQEYYDREIVERERLAAARHAVMPSMTSVPKPAPVNKFQHAPQSVFRPIDSNDSHRHDVFKPIPQLPQNLNTWQTPSESITHKPHPALTQTEPASPQFLSAKQSAQSTQHARSPSSNASSPIGLPWVAKPAVDNSDFKKKACNFEERSQNDNRTNSYLQRHHSLRSPKMDPRDQTDEYKKRPSLPSTSDPYMAAHSLYVPHQQQSQVYVSPNNLYAQPQSPPPPTNISFTYADVPRTSNYKSYPCLPSAVETSINAKYARQRESSLTNPNAIPLVLTSSNPTYEPPVERRLYNNGASQSYKQFEYVNPRDSAPASPSMFTNAQTDYTDDDLDSDNLMEYRAETRVMGKPKSQTAVTVRDRRSAHASDDEVFGKNSRSAQTLFHTMKNIGRNGNGALKVKREPARKVESPKGCLSPDGRAYQAPIVEPLFPKLTKFEPKRTPEYVEDPNLSKVTSKPQKVRAKTPPIPSQQQDHSLQLARAEEQYRREKEQQKHVEKTRANYGNISKATILQQQEKAQQQQPNSPISRVSNETSATATTPYVSETQAAYVVTYPKEEMHPADYARQLPTALPLQRSYNTSENSSASSSTSHNLPSPGANWTANPIHTVDEILPQRKQSLKHVDTNNSLPQPTYQSQSYAASTQKQNVKDVPQQKPKAATKKTSTNSQYVTLTSTYQQQYAELQGEKPLPPPRQAGKVEQPVPQPRYTDDKPQPQPRHMEKILPQPQPRTTAPLTQAAEKHATTQSLSQIKATPKLATRSQKFTTSTQSQSFDQHYQSQPKILSRQRTLAAASLTHTQAQNRVLSQQSLNASKQRQFEQREEETDQLSETRRKSHGNVFDVQKEQRKTAAYITESTKTVIKQEYKSSAPSDTPDIVKSSLPKDDMPILKKFGPPQRHHYVPNSYQSPAAANAQKQKYESSTTKVNVKSAQHEIVQHSTLTKKPSIVETPATPQPDEDLIPRNIVFRNISAFTSLSRRHEQQNSHHEARPRVNRLSKSDSWNQIVQIQNQANAQLPSTSPKFGSGSSSGGELRRTKSGHTLSVRMYEAGIDKSEIGEKQRTVAAYFSGKKSPNQMVDETVEMRTATKTKTTETSSTAIKKSSINRHKTNEKVSASRKSLTSTTTTANTMKQEATSTTEKTETQEKDGAVVTTTTKVTTRTVSGSGSSATKSVSPFAKFRQLDKQSSQQSPKSPPTPTTPGAKVSPGSGSARIFQFTDPALNARAATAKEQLLQWCQSKTQEYENIKITNFSASWSDGLAFCALIHHFLPDAFDYSKLTSKSRRHNFELAFTVADEKAGIAPLLDVEDMVEMSRPDWKCVFIYVQSIYRRFRNCQ